MEIQTTEEICINEVKYCDAHNIELSGSEDDANKRWILVDDLFEFLNTFKGDTPLGVIISGLYDEGVFTPNPSQSRKK
jgi:hypothetical protein